ncbi:MAG: agmatinase family protein, partial [Bdellovibrionales bacterium]|nr:agmatinase family protein [Bdellovibrionales bacterium]
MEPFNPSSPLSSDFGVFGLPIKRHDAKVILIPVPWEVTTSYGSGTSRGPEAIRRASSQLDLFDIELGKTYIAGFYMESINQKILGLNNELKPFAQRVRDELEDGVLSDHGAGYQHRVNEGSKEMVEWVYQGAKRIISDESKLLGIVGGDHSSPLGAIMAIGEDLGKDYAIIHIDAHADLRKAYMGFTHSHASIMYNVMTSDFAPQKLVQVGIRDLCWEEADFIQRDDRIRPVFGEDIKRRQYSGETWKAICEDILYGLPEYVYISLDIDGLSPEFCPHTGTPVPGGLHFSEVLFLLNALGQSGRTIVGFDLCEVAPGPEGDEW